MLHLQRVSLACRPAPSDMWVAKLLAATLSGSLYFRGPGHRPRSARFEHRFDGVTTFSSVSVATPISGAHGVRRIRHRAPKARPVTLRIAPPMAPPSHTQHHATKAGASP